MVWEFCPAFDQNLWEVLSVPNRSEIKFHVANYHRELNGCIGVGDLHLDIDNDGYRDLRNSRITLKRLHEYTQNMQNSKLFVYGDGRDTI